MKPKQAKEIYTLKDAVRKCGHKEDYSCTNQYRAEEFAASSKCSECTRAEFVEKTNKENVRKEIALKWLKEHGITDHGQYSIDASDSYHGSFPITIWIKG